MGGENHDLTPYKVTSDVMKNAGEQAIFLHCLPSFHDLKTEIGKEMGERFQLTDMEVTDEVFRSPQSKVFQEAEKPDAHHQGRDGGNPGSLIYGKYKRPEFSGSCGSGEGFVSGQELCEELGISRTAVWKYIRQLEAEGYRLEAVPNRGYCLRQVPDILSESEIQSRLHTRWVGQKVVCLAEVDSTNIRARRLAEEGAPSGTLVAADRQTKGRGSRGRSWESPAGESIYMTLLLRPEFSPASASMLTLVMGSFRGPGDGAGNRSGLADQMAQRCGAEREKGSGNSHGNERPGGLHRASGDRRRGECKRKRISTGAAG